MMIKITQQKKKVRMQIKYSNTKTKGKETGTHKPVIKTKLR